MITEVEGIIISEMPYGESSKIINLFTKDKGVIGIMCKGAKSMKSSLRSSTQVLSYGIFSIYYKENKLSTLKSVDIKESWKNIYQNLTKISYVTYLCELVSQVVKQSESSSVYADFIECVKKIEQGLDPMTITNVLELKCLPLLGVGLNLDSCIRCGSTKNIVTIDASYGGLICKNCYHNELIVDLKVLKLIRIYYYVDIASISTINVEDKYKQIINKFVSEYYDSFTGLYINSKKFLENLL